MKNNSAYISYLPMLLKAVSKTDGAILELGMGYSTMILHGLCQLTKRPIVSYENDPKWYIQNLCYSSNYHKILIVDNSGWENINIDNMYWSVVLIDHRPAKRRRLDALRLKDNATFIILHDSEPEIDRFYGYRGIYKHFKYVYHYKEAMPNTTVLSNFRDINL